MMISCGALLRFLERDPDEIDDDILWCSASFSERDPDEIDDDILWSPDPVFAAMIHCFVLVIAAFV